MGFNASRRYRDDKRHDIAVLIAAAVVIGALLAWGFGLL